LIFWKEYRNEVGSRNAEVGKRRRWIELKSEVGMRKAEKGDGRGQKRRDFPI
jgi:hypothetical protein